ncbi:anti-sigma factor family protein [Streptomyces sp. HMX87]|uniref:anti-sigma factor family protein n=1 Tax=Streptomyces sp. HMX87 TaxID=3390849 RepID=UPI003A878788
MTGHPDVTEISDLAEGLLPPSRSTDVRRHLDACEPCADVYASLEEIQGLLGTLPGPTRMPDDVAGRIDAALAAEALLSAAEVETPETDVRESEVRESETPEPLSANAPTARSGPLSLSADDSRADVSRETSVPADRPAGRARASTTGPGRKDRRRGGRRRLATLGAVFAAAALGLGSVIVASVDDGNPADEAQSHSSPADTFSEDRLKEQVTTLLSKSDGAQRGPRTSDDFGTESQTGPENRIFTQPTVPACIQKGIGRNDAPLATEEGVYQGKEALLVVVPDTSDASRVTAYIVEATCVDQTSVSTADVLLKHSYARP